MPINRHGYITTEQAAKHLGLKKNTLEKYRSIGNIGPKFYRLSPAAIRYKYCDLDDWMEQHSCVSPENYSA